MFRRINFLGDDLREREREREKALLLRERLDVELSIGHLSACGKGIQSFKGSMSVLCRFAPLRS